MIILIIIGLGVSLYVLFINYIYFPKEEYNSYYLLELFLPNSFLFLMGGTVAVFLMLSIIGILNFIFIKKKETDIEINNGEFSPLV